MAGRPEMLKLYNKRLLQRFIFEEGPVSKPDLAQMSNLSLQTVNKIVDELVEEGVVLEGGMLSHNGAGRRARSYVFNRNSGSVIVLNYSEHKWEGSIVDLYGDLIDKKDFVHESQTNDHTIETIKRHIESLQGRSDRVRAIGVGIPGAVLANGLVIGIPSLPDLEGVNLEDVLAQEYGLPVVVENDVKLMTVGYHTRHMPDSQNMVFLYIAKGLGSGLILNGQLYKGSNSFAGEFGYMPASDVKDRGDLHYVHGGSLESYVTGIKQKVLAGDQEKRADFIKKISQVIINYSAVVNPEAFVLYCDFIDETEVRRIYRHVSQYLPPDSVPRIKLIRDTECGVDGLVRLCLTGIRPWTQMLKAFDHS